MTALTADRRTPRREGNKRIGFVAASQTIYFGAIVMRNEEGYLVNGSTAPGLVGVGMALERVINDGEDGKAALLFEVGQFLFANSGGAEAITIADIGKPAWAVDDQTVAKKSGANRSIAGFIADVDENGVWIEFDEAKVQTYIAGVSLP